MAALFQSFGSSQMPKRLLRYALARFDLLDESTLDMDNLDFALGKSTVLEFRDVGIKLKKLQKLLQLPSALQLQKAKATVLRVTVPIDFFSGSILIEVDGVAVTLKVLNPERKTPIPKTSEESLVPNPVDLAQSFLELQPISERRKLEEALSAETHDLAASQVSTSDDGSEEEAPLGTGQSLSLPAFLAGFLQGIIDRMQVRIKGVTFNLDVEVPVDPNSPNTEPVSLQIALDNIEVEGVTAQSEDDSTILPKDGKRQVSLNRVRAYLISEANVFSALTQSPSVGSMASQSLSSFSSRNRSPPSREASRFGQDSFHGSIATSHQAPGFEHDIVHSSIAGSTLQQSLLNDHDDHEASALYQDSVYNSMAGPAHHQSVAHNAEASEFHQDSFHSSMATSQEVTGSRHGTSHGSPVTSALHRSFSDSVYDQDPFIEDATGFHDSFHSSSGNPQEADVFLQNSLHNSMPDSTVLQQSFRSSMLEQDPEAALDIPYEFSDPEETQEDEGPATPRASVYHGFDDSPEQSMFHSTILPGHPLAQTTAFETEVPVWASAYSESRSEPALRPASPTDPVISSTENIQAAQQGPSIGPPSHSSVEDLTQSHLFTHEQAESMYMSAFSSDSIQASTHPITSKVQPQSSTEVAAIGWEPQTTSGKNFTLPQTPPKQKSPLPQTHPREESPTPRSTMPGGWDEEFDSSKYTSSSSTSQPSTTKSMYESNATTGNQSSLPLRQGAQDADVLLKEPQTEIEPGEVPTPKGPTKLVKEILMLDTISLYIPSANQPAHVYAASAESVSTLAESMGRSVGPQASGASLNDVARKQARKKVLSDLGEEQADHSLEVDFSPISVRFDTSLGFLFAMVASKLLAAIKPQVQEPSTKDQQKNETSKAPETKVRFQEISFDFINHLGGVIDTAGRYIDPTAFILEHEVLLNATLKNLEISVSTAEMTQSTPGTLPNQNVLVTKIELETFRFGYEQGDIVSFDKNQPMSTSIRDTFLSSGWDIGIKITQSAGKVRTDIETLPLAVHIDLQRLDETFSWFGGLSSLLSMSASITSSHSPTAKSAPAKHLKPRGVRFDMPLDPERSAASENKANIRIAGAFVQLQGKDCSVFTNAGTIKLVSRDEALGISIRKLRITGPFHKYSQSDPPIITDISDVRLDYLTTPKDEDLERLLELIMPSKARFDEGNDGIMVDTLLRQRRKGSVLRVTVETVNVRVKNLAQLDVLPDLGEEVAKLSTVAKYLPEDDRPGLLMLGRVHKLNLSVETGGQLGRFDAELDQFNIGHISVPSLTAVSAYGISVKRNENEELVGFQIATTRETPERSPVIMGRMIGDEIEPVIKLKLHNLIVEYRVPFIMDLLGLAEDATPQDFESGLAASVANLGDQAQIALRHPGQIDKSTQGKPMTLDVGFEDCLIGLNPLKISSKMVVALTDARLKVVLPKDVETKADLRIKKSSILLIDDIALAAEGSARPSARRASYSSSNQVLDMCAKGFVNICYISSASVVANATPGDNGEKQVHVEIMDDLLVLETCADSTQTLISLVNALKPPTPESKEDKFRTNVMPLADLLSSISAEAFGNPEGEYDFDQDFAGAQEMAGSVSDLGSDHEISDDQHYGPQLRGTTLFDAMETSTLLDGTTMQDTDEGVLLTETHQFSNLGSDSGDELVIHDNFYAQDTQYDATAKIWSWTKSVIDRAPKKLVERSPFKVSVRDVHFIWNLFDGYDWVRTRDVITQTVQQVEARAMELQSGHSSRNEGAGIYEEEIEDQEAIGDCLFNSIYIGIASGRDPQDLTRAINEELNDNATETESIAPTAYTGASNRTSRPLPPHGKRLRLKRSKQHKITFELQGVNADMVAYPSDEQKTHSNVSIRIHNLDIFDHVPTSTWKKFATYDQDAGEREMDSSMVQIDLLNVKPMPEVASSDIVLRVAVQPLRLHVDQDALDFITRFFEFKDDSIPVHASPSDVPFIMRVEILDIPVKLDFKPKRVDYTGLRAGRTTEMMNFIIMEEARMVLKHVILGGVSGFDKMGKSLNDIWMADVKGNQLPTVLAGLAPVRSLVNIGSGFKDLVEIPIQEYRKDGRVFRSMTKGASAFARTTGTEIVKLGAKLAVGTQYALQGAEGMFTAQQPGNDDIDPEEQKQISLYADQPLNVIQGLRGGYRSLARDINMARNAIIAVPGEMAQSDGPGGAAKAALMRAPTIILRPAMGVSKAIGQTLMGATNSIDSQHQRRIDQKYKKH